MEMDSENGLVGLDGIPGHLNITNNVANHASVSLLTRKEKLTQGRRGRHS